MARNDWNDPQCDRHLSRARHPNRGQVSGSRFYHHKLRCIRCSRLYPGLHSKKIDSIHPGNLLQAAEFDQKSQAGVQLLSDAVLGVKSFARLVRMALLFVGIYETGKKRSRCGHMHAQYNWHDGLKKKKKGKRQKKRERESNTVRAAEMV